MVVVMLFMFFGFPILCAIFGGQGWALALLIFGAYGLFSSPLILLPTDDVSNEERIMVFAFVFFFCLSYCIVGWLLLT